mgnify:FL=1
MLYPGFISGSYDLQSPLADMERTVNWYPEQIASAAIPWGAALFPTPGQDTFLTVGTVNTRALFSMNDRVHAVVGNTLYELFAGATSASRGTMLEDPNPASIASNGDAGDELLIASGTNGYLLNLSTNGLSTVLTGDCVMAGMLDGYFLAFDTATSTFRISALNDGTSWDATQYAQRSIAPDPWRAMVVDGNRQIWLIGEQTGEVWYDSGASPFPFEPVPGSVFGYGTPAPWTVKLAGSTMCWLSQTADGAGIVVGATGLIPQRISTNAVDTAIAGYIRTAKITDAEALVYEMDGHTFYVLSFPSANATWCFDLTTGIWHERGMWDSAAGAYDLWSPRVHCFGFSKHLVGDRDSGLLCTMDNATTTECDGSTIRRLRIPPPIWRSPGVRRLFVSRLQLMMEVGLGTSTGAGVDPQVMLRSSTDGQTWSDERLAAAGAQGAYLTQVVWTRLPSSTQLWVPEITVTDPIPWRLMGAEVDGRGLWMQAA